MSARRIVTIEELKGKTCFKLQKSKIRENDNEDLLHVHYIYCLRGAYVYCGARVPPLDFSHAFFLHFDATLLMLHHPLAYKSLLQFQSVCKSRHHIQWFHSRVDDGPQFKSYTGKELSDMDAAHNAVVVAIDQYNSSAKKRNLKLERLIQANYFEVNNQLRTRYMTFYAIDVESGISEVYQAIIAVHGGQQILGLFRNFSQDKILAIISFSAAASGVDEDLAMKKKDRGVDEALAMKEKDRGVDEDLAKNEKDRGVDEALAMEQKDRGVDENLAKNEKDRGVDEDLARKEKNRGVDRGVAVEEKNRGVDRGVAVEEKNRGVDRGLAVEEKDRGVDEDLAMKEKDRGVDEDLAMEEKDRGVDENLAKIEKDRGVDEDLARKEKNRGVDEGLAVKKKTHGMLTWLLCK